MNTENETGKKIRELRKGLGYTQQKLAELVGIDDKHLSKIENGVHFPTFQTLKKLSEVLNFELQDIGSISSEQQLIHQNPIYQKAVKILNSAKNDAELQNYYDVLKLGE